MNTKKESAIFDDIKPERDREKDKQNILTAVSEYSSDNIRHKVALILNNFPNTRNSDIELQIKYWEIYQKELLSGSSILIENYPFLEKLSTIARARAFIQNTCGLFQASPEVRDQRGLLAEEEKANIKKDKPDYPPITVFADESGKNGKYLIVGSIWFLDDMSSNDLLRVIFDWRQTNNVKNEFHFTNINDRNLNSYKAFVNLLIARSSTIGLRAITVEKAGISNTQDAFIRLYSHILIKGIQHEQDSGRATLPRYIQFVKDKEEVGYDNLLLAEVKDRLNIASQARFENKLYIDFIKAEDSKEDPFLQVADLFASSLNRIYNNTGTPINAKDDFAKYFLDSFGVPAKLSDIVKESDMSFHLSL